MKKMRFSLLCCPILLFGQLCAADTATADQQAKPIVAKKDTLAEASKDSLAPIIKKAELLSTHPSTAAAAGYANAEKQTMVGNGVAVKRPGSVSLVCYKSGICLVKDTRAVKARRGINTLEFADLFSGLLQESISFRTPKNGKFVVLNHAFHPKNLSRCGLFTSAVGKDVFFYIDEGAKELGARLEKGKLLNISTEKGSDYAIIASAADQKCFVLPLEQCVAIDSKITDLVERNSMSVTFESAEQIDADFEISYLTSDITWQHVCVVDIFEKLDRIDVSSRAILNNRTNADLKNVTVIFDTSMPAIPTEQTNAAANQPNATKETVVATANTAHRYTKRITAKSNSSSTCVLQSVKGVKPGLEYIARIPSTFFDSSSSDEIDLLVNNLLIVENVEGLGLHSNIDSSYAILFQRVTGEKNFIGKQPISAITSGNNLVFEVGSTTDIVVKAQQTDFKKLSETQVEYGVRVAVKNNKVADAAVIINADVAGSWSITKKNFDLQSESRPAWRLELKAGELKELYYRIRLVKQK
jgi:hypothetical protein